MIGNWHITDIFCGKEAAAWKKTSSKAQHQDLTKRAEDREQWRMIVHDASNLVERKDEDKTRLMSKAIAVCMLFLKQKLVSTDSKFLFKERQIVLI